MLQVPLWCRMMGNKGRDFSYRVQEDGTIEILEYLGTSKAVKVPDTVEGMEVTRIGNQAFYDSTVETITIRLLQV
ncbi:MAG: hypothetical protein ACLTXT_01755 [Ruminococcus callidus]